MIRNTRSGTSLLLSGQLKKLSNPKTFCASVCSTEDGHVGTVKTIYERWLSDPNDVAPAWDSFFKSVSQHERSTPKVENPAGTSGQRFETFGRRNYHDKYGFEHLQQEEGNVKNLQQVLLVHRLIRSYQVRGHHLAKLDPLDCNRIEKLPLFGRGRDALCKHYADEHRNLLRKVQYELDMEKTYPLPIPTTHIGGEDCTSLKLSEIIRRLEKVYCDRTGLEYMHINSYNQCDYLRKQFELPTSVKLSVDQKRLLLARLARASGFEEFVNKYYPQAKKHSLEGCEALIPCIKTIIDNCTNYGVDHFVFGMPHRGRMNVLSNVFRMPLVQIISLLNQLQPENSGVGDVVYRLGADRTKLNSASNKKTRLTMLAAPAHLEGVNAVVLGRTKIEQMMRNKEDRVMPILVHSDVAFSGRGISYETMNLSNLPAFNTLGTIHIILNNQVGSTLNASTTGSYPYSTDLGKIINAPIFHVNADDPEAVEHVSRVAANWRNIFRMDCVVELIAYRRHGSDLLDDPVVVNPFQHNRINETPNVYEKYVDQLRDDNIVAVEEAPSIGLEMANDVDATKSMAKGGDKNDDTLNNIRREYREIFEEVEKMEKERREKRKRLDKLKELRRAERVKLAEKLLQLKRNVKPKKNKKK